MSRSIDDHIRKSRNVLEDPYAHLNSHGGYDALASYEQLSVHGQRRLLENQFAFLNPNGGFDDWSAPTGRSQHPPASIEIEVLLGGRERSGRFTKQDIEAIARKLQIEMWIRRAELLPSRDDIDALDILDPTLALQSLGYSVLTSESLGQYAAGREVFEVAGVIDHSNAEVHVSRHFSPEIRKFTAAHELGHSILHAESGLHRDRPMDGAAAARPRDPKELEADAFAAYFLLPEKQVRGAFQSRFLTTSFELNDITAFALGSKDVRSMGSRCRTLRDLARMLGSAEYFNGVHFRSLEKKFGVSTETMAIRIEELHLIKVRS